MTTTTRMGQTGQAAHGGQTGHGGPGGQAAKTTLIEDDTEFKGSLSSKCPVVVRGSIHGDVAGPSLHVSPSGSVSGKVKVGQLRSEGVIAGEFDADVVQLAGTVKSDTIIRARSLEVRLAPQSGRLQVTFGQCELAVGDVPSKEEAVSAAATRSAAGARSGDGAAVDDVPTAVRESAKRELEKREPEKREPDKREAEKREADKREAEKREPDKREAEKREADKRDLEKRETEKIDRLDRAGEGESGGANRPRSRDSSRSTTP